MIVLQSLNFKNNISVLLQIDIADTANRLLNLVWKYRKKILFVVLKKSHSQHFPLKMTNESANQLEENEIQCLINDLKCVPTQEKIKEAGYVPADNAVCTIKANASVDVLI